MKELVLKAKSDKQSKLALITQFEPLIKKTIKTYLRDFSVYNDALQESYLTVIKCIELYDASSEVQFSGYLKRALINNCLYMLRKTKPCVSLDIEFNNAEGLTLLDTLASDIDIELEYINEIQHTSLKKAYLSLPEKHRSILDQVYFQKKTMRMISKERGCHYNTVVNAKDAAIKALRHCMSEYLTDSDFCE